jgi:hypothetical protein
MTTQNEKEAQATSTRDEESRFADGIERLREAKRRADKRAKKANELEARLQAKTHEEATSYDSISKAIEKLNGSELVRLQSEITALLSLRSGRNHDAEDSNDVEDIRFGLRAICHMLQRNGLEHGSVTALQRHRDFAKFRSQYAAVNKFFDAAKLDSGQRRTLFKVGVEMLYDNLCELGIPVTAATLMNHTHRIPAVINLGFPGYARSGLLRLIVKCYDNRTETAEQEPNNKSRTDVE